MSYAVLKFIKSLRVEGKEVTENLILEWAHSKVGNKHPKIENFKDTTLRNGLFLIYLLDSVEPGFINYHIVSKGESGLGYNYFLLK